MVLPIHQRRNKFEWHVAQELANRYRGKLTWNPQAKEWRDENGKEAIIGELHFQPTIGVICNQLHEKVPRYHKFIWGCTQYQAMRRISENVKWLLRSETIADKQHHEQVKTLETRLAKIVATATGADDLF